MKPSDSFGHVKACRKKLSSAALLGCCLLITVILVCLIKSSSNAISTLSLQLSICANVSLPMVQKSNTREEAADAVTSPHSSPMEEKKVNESGIGNRTVTLQLQYEDMQGGDDPDAGFEDSTSSQLYNDPVGENLIEQSRVVCDFTNERSDTCWMDGDVRVLGKSSTIMLASPPTAQTAAENTTWKIRPYTRKWESTQELIKELTVTLAADPERAPRCMTNHSVPAVFFSTGGFVGNCFHDFTDVLIPLFMTSRRFNGRVRFVVSDFNRQFIDKYQPILKQLSHYPAIDMDADDRVHCFPHAHVGLLSHKVLGIDPSRSPNGISMHDFRDFLRMCFSLDQQARSRKPRLLLILRKGSRSFVNEGEVIRTVQGVGFELITAGPEETKNLSGFAQVVNSVDVLMGIHGAGLTNMVFLPTNATLVQIIPCCGIGMQVGCRHIFAQPAPDMGIRYVDYAVKEEESSLIERYPRDHAVFKDPLSIMNQQGFFTFWNIFLNQQKVKIDVPRFRSMLSQVLQSIKN